MSVWVDSVVMSTKEMSGRGKKPRKDRVRVGIGGLQETVWMKIGGTTVNRKAKLFEE